MNFPVKLTPKDIVQRHFYSFLALLLVALCPLSATANDTVRLQLKWPHHYMFAGYYAAKEKGYYQAAGLNVELIPGKKGEDPVQKVLDGKAEFGVGTCDLLIRREQGAPVVVLAVIFQQREHDLTGRNLKNEPGHSPLHDYLRSEGVPADKIIPLAQSFRAEDLSAGITDVFCTNAGDDPAALNKAALQKQTSPHGSTGADFYGDNLFTTESQLKLNPEMVKAFREASLKGWKYAMNHPGEIAQLIRTRYTQQYSVEHLRFEAHQMESLLQTPLMEIGHMNPDHWRHIAEVYAEMGMMKPDFSLKGFLYNPNSPPDLKWLYGGLAAALALMLAAAMIAIRFTRLSTTLKNTITDYKQVGDALRESESLYLSVLNASPDNITITDTEGFIIMISPAGVMMFGHKREEELLGRNVIEFIAPEDRDRARSNLKQTLQGLFPGSGEYRAIRPDGGTIDIESNSQTILNAEGEPASIVFVVRDITERKQAGHSCLVAMGEMIGAIAHQWRQPLATLGMIVQRTHAVGTMQGLTAEGLDEFKANAMRQIRYMSDTIEEFRGFYRTEKQKEPFSPLSCITDSARLFEPQFTSHGIVVNVHCRECDEQLVDGYPNEFKQVILNLLGNARDAILESRKTNGQSEEGRITIRLSVQEDKTMIIDVNDNGCGIADDIAPRVLDPYFTTKEDSGGTGLGLYMSSRIVEDSLGGHLTLLQCYEGATFRIELPLWKTL
ncbi:MAG: ABC transporter substrate-binding protein [Desulfuromonadaceae bacterium]|nr:ABC transporter substrate-binding protein [Desulfuromonadaceae bacterium]